MKRNLFGETSTLTLVGDGNCSSKNSRKRVDEKHITTKGSVKMIGIFQEDIKKDPKNLYDILKSKPESEESEVICNDKELFQKIKPIYWIAVAKEHSSLFQKILGKPELAKWVNQFPSDDHQGLTMIATYTNEHFQLAYAALLDQKKSDKKIFSEKQCEDIETYCTVYPVLH